MNNLILKSLQNKSFLPFPDISFHNNDSDKLEYSNRSGPSTWKFVGCDTYQLYLKNLKRQPESWYYRHNDVNYTLNSLGYRTKEFDQVDWENSIAIFGCSYVFGTGVDDKHTISSFLEDETGIPVINFGVNGSSIMFQLHNSSVLHNYYPKPRAVIYLWTSLLRGFVYSSNNIIHYYNDDCITEINDFGRDQNMFLTHHNLITMNLLAISYIRNLWKNETKFIEYTISGDAGDDKSSNFINTFLPDYSCTSIIDNLLHPSLKYTARDVNENGIAHPGKNLNFNISKKLSLLI